MGDFCYILQACETHIFCYFMYFYGLKKQRNNLCEIIHEMCMCNQQIACHNLNQYTLHQTRHFSATSYYEVCHNPVRANPLILNAISRRFLQVSLNHLLGNRWHYNPVHVVASMLFYINDKWCIIDVQCRQTPGPWLYGHTWYQTRNIKPKRK